MSLADGNAGPRGWEWTIASSLFPFVRNDLSAPINSAGSISNSVALASLLVMGMN
jgi:hypothetical protein